MIIYIKLILQVSISFSKYLLSVVYVLNIILRGRDKSGNKVDKHSCPGGARASPIAQLVKSLPAMEETLVQFLGQEDPLEKG